jgi:hypothetical protein
VSKVSAGREMFLSIKVKPAADLSRLEEVLVVTEKQEREPVAESGDSRGRAADILAQRLPSVPEKPATVAGANPAGTRAAASDATGQDAGAGEKPQPNGAAKIVTETGTTGGVLKKVVQKPAAGDSGKNGRSGSGTGSSAALSATPNATSNASPKSANSTPKPATAPSKPSSPQSSSQPPATEDNPH